MRSFMVIVDTPDDFGNELTAHEIEEAIRDYGWTVKVTRITDEDGE